jgi:hypothetical protein
LRWFFLKLSDGRDAKNYNSPTATGQRCLRGVSRHAAFWAAGVIFKLRFPTDPFVPCSIGGPDFPKPSAIGPSGHRALRERRPFMTQADKLYFVTDVCFWPKADIAI